jgi:hypothetical protein
MPRRKRPPEQQPWGKVIPYTSPNGRTTTLYNIGYLAEQVGRTSQTIRRWEIAGVLPPTPFRQQGKRLYSQEHVDAVVRCAEKYRITLGIQLPKGFAKSLYKEFQELNDYFFKEVKSYGTEKEED